MEEILQASGAGSQAPPGADVPDDTNWSVALSASLSLFSGGQRRAQRVQAELELERLELQWETVAEKLEEGIRSSMIAARASYVSIDLSREAASAANRNLQLVADSYARGAVSILDLLDAQNAALNADLDAANAVYDFFIDLMRVQRSANHFDFFVSPAARDAWYERLDLFYGEAGVEPWSPPPEPRSDLDESEER